MCLPPPELVSPSLLAPESHLFAHPTQAPALPGCPEINLCPEEEVTKEEPLLENKGHLGPDLAAELHRPEAVSLPAHSPRPTHELQCQAGLMERSAAGCRGLEGLGILILEGGILALG